MNRANGSRRGLLVAALGIAVACGDATAPASRHSEPVGRVVFQMRRNWIWDVYTALPDGSDLRNLTNSPADDLHPAWSRDHAHIVFESATSPAGFYIMDADGGGRRLILSGYFAEHFSWSPDGRQIAFLGSDGSGYRIFVINADGTGLHALVANTLDPRMPDWSPDGRRIAFAAGYSGNSDIYVMNADGSGAVNLTGAVNRSNELDPAWSPDGARIAFASDRRGHAEVYTMRADGSDWRSVTGTSGNGSDDRQPHWSSDGAQLVFERSVFPTAQVYAVRTDGSSLHVVADTLSGNPSW